MARPEKKNAVRLAMALLGLAALAAGLVQGGYQDTLGKAVRLCMECVGIG